MKKFTQSFRFKLVLISVVVEIIMLGLLLANSIRLMNLAIKDQTQIRIDSVSPLLSAAMGRAIFERDYASMNEIMRQLMRSEIEGFRYLMVIDNDNHRFAHVGDIPIEELPLLDQDIEAAMEDGVYDGVAELKVGGLVVGEVRYGLSLATVLKAKSNLFSQGVLIALLEISLTLVLLGLTGFLLTRHLTSLLRGTVDITNGNYDVDFPIRSQDEIGILARSFEQMASTIKQRMLELKRSEAALSHSNANFEAVFGSMVESVIFTDAQRKLILVNPTFEKMFRFSQQELVGKTLEPIYVNEDDYIKQGELRYRPDAEYHQQIYEMHYRRKDGSSFIGEVMSSEVRDNAGHLLGYVGIIRDVTDRNEQQKALQREQERAQVTLESIGDAVITTSKEGMVEYLNPVAEELTGWTKEEAKARPLSEVFHIINESSGKVVENPVERCLRDNAIVGLANHTVLISRSGEQFAIEDSAAPIRDSEGEIIGVVLVFHDVSKARKMANQLSWQATHDSLTGLHNRREFEQRLEKALEKAKTESCEHSLLYLDLDQFKLVNDTSGHVAGDELLRQLTDSLKTKVRDSDMLARLGGDEFGVLLEYCPLDRAISIAEQLRKQIESFSFIWEDKRFNIGVSIGVVSFNEQSESMAEILSAADVACYAAKDNGRNQVHVYQYDDDALQVRHGEMLWVSRINDALRDNRFILYRQSIVSLQEPSRRFSEILIRLQEGGEIISPGAFISAAERYALMPQLDRWVVKTLFEYLRHHPQEAGCKFFVNLSGLTLGDKGFLDFVESELKRCQLDSSTICFEITETAAISNLSVAMKFISRLKQIGCYFALDDFGSGLSSFSYLKNMSVDYLKIDGLFVREMSRDLVNRAMIEAIHKVGDVMGIETIAEHVEDQETMELLRAMGVDYMQGYVIEHPHPLDD